MMLRLGQPLHTLRPSLHNGPGWRVALWTQGCSLRCTSRCLNPALLDAEGGWEYEVEEIVLAVMMAQRWQREPIEGVTVLGGEPVDQMEGVAALFTATREAGLTNMLYTGWTLEALHRRHGRAAEELLSAVDLLKAGPFVESLYDPLLAWRGSTNQKLICLSERYDSASLEDAWREQMKSSSFLADPHGVIVHASGLQRDPASFPAVSTS